MAMSQKTRLKVAIWNAMRLHENNPGHALAAVKAQLAEGSSPNDGYAGWVPLGWAIRNRAPEMACALVEAGADVNALENHKSMLSMCLLTPGMETVVEHLLAHGATPAGSIMASAAKRGNEHLVRWCLASGLLPNDLPRVPLPILCLWPAKKPVPDDLLLASFHPPVSIRAARKFVQLITRRKNLVLLEAFMDQAKPPDEVRHMLLRHAIEARWKTGLERLLTRGYFDPAYRNPVQPSLLVSCATWINARNPSPGLKVLANLLDRGHPLVMSKEPVLAQDEPLAVDPYVLLRSTPLARAALLDFLHARGLPPFVQASQDAPVCQTLAHVLIRCRDWDALRTLSARYPGVAWEHPLAPGLLATWAATLPKDRNATPMAVEEMEASLDIVLSLPGFDLHRCNARGESGLRVFMQRPGGSGFSRITTRLLHAGLDPRRPDHQGISDLDFAATMKLPPGLLEEFQALALHLSTQKSTGSSSARRL